MTIHRLAQQVAAYLGPDWKAVPKYKHNCFLEGPQKMQLLLAPSGWEYNPEGRLEITGRLPDDECRRVHPPVQEPHIGLSARKSAAQVAREIQRRLLPKYQPLHEQLSARAQQRQQKHEHQYQMLQRLAAALGTRPDSSPEDPIQKISMPWSSTLHATFSVSIGGHVSINIPAAPFEMALQVARLLATAEAKSK